MPIHVLDQETINKIAAGEVIERPMAVVKELVENAIDAGASSITVEIKDGGKSLIRVTDNGTGIEKDDIRLAFEPHATSKIGQMGDLSHISTLGFRGEALSSIASVSQLEMITKTRKELGGFRYLIDGGDEKKLEEAGCPDGTTFLVRSLFYNTPARLKFLKTAQTEAGYISGVLEKMALSHPEISFKFINQNQPALHTLGNMNLKDTIYSIYGRDIASNLLDANIKKENAKIEGYIGKPVLARGSARYMNYFINGRYIKNSIIYRAIEDAYSPYMMRHKYPFTVLHLKIPFELTDVNVHPQKMEIRFTNEKEIYNDVFDAISEILRHKEFIPDVKFAPYDEKNEPEEKKPIPDENHDESRGTGFVNLRSLTAEETAALFDKDRPQKEINEKNQSVFMEKAAYASTRDEKQETLFESNVLSPQAQKEIKIIGQVFSTYWILQYNDDMFLIDQHAAHEKVLYERFMRQIKKNEPLTQEFEPPAVLSLSLLERQALEDNMEIFERLGYRIENFGGGEYMVSGMPANLPNVDVGSLLIEIIDDLATIKKRGAPEAILERVAEMSCKAAVKGGSNLTEEEARKLLMELMALDNPYNCPHGRPTMIRIEKKELEKKFKRTL